MNKFANGYTETFVILNSLVEEDYDKIPPEVIQAIDENRNKDYIFELYYDIELKEQILLPETRAILFNIFRDYLATPEQKEKIIRMQNEERQKLEAKKQEMYSVNIFETKKDENKKEKLELIEYKESFFKKIWKHIKNILKKH